MLLHVAPDRTPEGPLGQCPVDLRVVLIESLQKQEDGDFLRAVANGTELTGMAILRWCRIAWNALDA